jgi:hypothetical protein
MTRHPRATILDQNIRNKLNEIRQQQLESDKNQRSNKPPATASDKSLLIAVLGGVAAGFITAWLMYSLLSTKNVDRIAQDSRVAIQENEIRAANKSIEMLNDRVVSLTKSISSLGAELTQVLELADPDKIIVKTTFTDQGTPKPAEKKPLSTMASSLAQGVSDRAANIDETFIPTHVVKTRLNLRASTSLDNPPIGVLSTGTQVRYIDEVNGWYYIDTERFGKGWCASKYLSPLSPP